MRGTGAGTEGHQAVDRWPILLPPQGLTVFVPVQRSRQPVACLLPLSSWLSEWRPLPPTLADPFGARGEGSDPWLWMSEWSPHFPDSEGGSFKCNQRARNVLVLPPEVSSCHWPPQDHRSSHPGSHRLSWTYFLKCPQSLYWSLCMQGSFRVPLAFPTRERVLGAQGGFCLVSPAGPYAAEGPSERL